MICLSMKKKKKKLSEMKILWSNFLKKFIVRNILSATYVYKHCQKLLKPELLFISNVRDCTLCMQILNIQTRAVNM